MMRSHFNHIQRIQIHISIKSILVLCCDQFFVVKPIPNAHDFHLGIFWREFYKDLKIDGTRRIQLLQINIIYVYEYEYSKRMLHHN